VTDVTSREVDGVSVVTLYGRIVFGEGSNIVREKVNSLIGGAKKKIVLDMKDMDYIDSSGLRALVAAHLGAKTHGAEMRLCNLGRKFSKALQQALAQTMIKTRIQTKEHGRRPYWTAFFTSSSSARRRVNRMTTPAVKHTEPRIPGAGYVSCPTFVVGESGGLVTTCFGVIKSMA